ncbi:Hemicentin-1 [Oryzias melastigma]|uniref:Hemicentin-1 n=1 Tax=Oryzias melastigma TaxID=30732 RepID=A0A834KZT6_ORYME|nr:Hemicentin-1 [Oryzias melastigma]
MATDRPMNEAAHRESSRLSRLPIPCPREKLHLVFDVKEKLTTIGPQSRNMAGIQTIFTLLVICLMKGFLCIQTKREFNIIIPETVEVLTGSCLTIPCSFDIRKEYDEKLNRNCKGTWVAPGTKTTKLPPVDKIGNLTEKNCTSTFLNMNSDHAASCLSHPPTLTWTPKLADSQETLKENQDQTKVQISVLNFTASHLHHGKRITCTAVYWKHGGSGVSVNSSLTANIRFPPWIRPLSICTKAGNQINCSCETDGNPAPSLIWLLNEKTVNQSETTKIFTDSLNKTYLRSSIILSLSQINDFTKLICSSSNYLGSTKHQFSLNDLKTPDEEPLLLIILLTVSLLVLMFVLLFVIRFLNKRHKLNKGPLADRNEETAEDNIYASTSELGEEDTAQPLNDSQRTSDNFSSSAATEGPSVSPGNDQEDVTYASVTFKAKRNSKAGKKSGDFSVCEKSCQTEERFVVEDAGKNFVRNALEMGTVYAEVVTKKKVECEYASVNFKTKTNKTA